MKSMNLIIRLSPLFLLLFICSKSSEAFFRTEALFKPSARDRFFDEQFSFYLKDSKPKLSPNQRQLVVHLATAAIKKISSYNWNYANSNSTNSPLQSMRAIGNQFGLSTKAVGSLALISLLAYGTFASMAPNLKNEISRQLSKEDKEGLQNLLMNCMVGISDSFMKWVERSVNELPSLPRINAQECIKRSICEANKEPKRYGLLGIALQFFFPPKINETIPPDHTLSKYQLAAQYGKGREANCAAQYDDCILNLLDIAQGMVKLVF